MSNPLFDLVAALLLLFPQLAEPSLRLPGFHGDYPNYPSEAFTAALTRVLTAAEIDNPLQTFPYGYYSFHYCVESASNEFWSLAPTTPRRDSYAHLLPPDGVAFANLRQAREVLQGLLDRQNFLDRGRADFYEPLIEDAKFRIEVWSTLASLARDAGPSANRNLALKLMTLLGPRAFFAGRFPSPTSGPASLLVFPREETPQGKGAAHPSDLPD